MNPSDWTSRTQISIDGQTYSSAADMPPAVRARYEHAMQAFDRDGNGVPDVLEGAAADPNVISQVTTHERVIVNGREYSSWSEVPSALRSAMVSGRSGLSINGIPISWALVFLLGAAALVGAAIMWALMR